MERRIDDDPFLLAIVLARYPWNRHVKSCECPRNGFICTRAKDHTGPHVAHGSSDIAFLIWTNEDFADSQ